ncbi:MAG: flavin reductase family protein [Methanomassiliicoccales archaeon]|nr:MAG: flavin reductase family protein [Methanomassiliicoccales archaeon]
MVKRNVKRKLPPMVMPVCMVGSMTDGRPNFCTIAWFTMIDDEPPMIGVVMGKKRRTKDGIIASKAFSVNLPDTSSCVKTDYVGMCSGYDVDKSKVFDRIFYGVTGSPMIDDCPVTVDCTLERIVEFEGVDLVVGKIEDVYVESSSLTGDDVDIRKIDPLLYSFPGGPYMSFGAKVADAFKIGKDFNKG